MRHNSGTWFKGDPRAQAAGRMGGREKLGCYKGSYYRRGLIYDQAGKLVITDPRIDDVLKYNMAKYLGIIGRSRAWYYRNRR